MFDIVCYTNEVLKICWASLFFGTIFTLCAGEKDTQANSLITIISAFATVLVSILQLLIIIYLSCISSFTLAVYLILPICLIFIAWGMIWENHERWVCWYLGIVCVVLGILTALIYSLYSLFTCSRLFWKNILC